MSGSWARGRVVLEALCRLTPNGRHADAGDYHYRLGIAAVVDRQVNNSRVTDRVVSLALEIKRGFLGR